MVVDGDELSFEDLTNLSHDERARIISLARGRMRSLATDIGYYGAQWSGDHIIRVAHAAAELQCCIQVLLVVGFDPDKDNY